MGVAIHLQTHTGTRVISGGYRGPRWDRADSRGREQYPMVVCAIDHLNKEGGGILLAPEYLGNLQLKTYTLKLLVTRAILKPEVDI